MPVVNGKHYPYTKAGKKAAHKAKVKSAWRKGTGHIKGMNNKRKKVDKAARTQGF